MGCINTCVHADRGHLVIGTTWAGSPLPCVPTVCSEPAVTGRWNALILIYLTIMCMQAVVMENLAWWHFHGPPRCCNVAAVSYQGKWRHVLGEEGRSHSGIKNGFPNDSLWIAPQHSCSARPQWFGCMIAALVGVGRCCRDGWAAIPKASWLCVLELRQQCWWNNALSELHWCLQV